jgi:hypothetical protein
VVEVAAFPASGLYVNIREGTITGQLLGTSAPGIEGGFGAHFDFPSPIALLPDHLYVLEVVTFACSACGVTDDSGFQRRDADYYHRGRMIYDGMPVEGTPLNYLTDLTFRTGSTIVPEPASLLLLFCAAGILSACQRRRFATAQRSIVPIASMFGLVASLAVATAASAAPLTFSFTDPAGDGSGGSRVDVLSLVVNFDNATGDFEAHVTGRPYCCRTLDRIFLKLFNPDTGTTSQDPSFFNNTWSVRWYEPDGTTVVTVTGTDPILRAWNAGNRVATSDVRFGNPDGISEFQSTVRTYLAVEEHRPPRLQGYDHISPTEIATIVPASPPLGGDYNADGSVDAADYVVWRKNPGGIYTPDDYNVWCAQFGETSGNGAAFSTFLPIPTSIPEPSSAAFVIPTLVASIFQRRRARALGIGGRSGTILAIRMQHGYNTISITSTEQL